MRIAPLFVMLFVAACAPTLQPAPVPAPSTPPMSPLVMVHPSFVSSEEAKSCASKGGHFERVGKLQALRCIVTYADAGKACTDGAQCLGQRCMGAEADEAAPAPVAGHCVATNDPFGCQTIIRDGKAATICVD